MVIVDWEFSRIKPFLVIATPDLFLLISVRPLSSLAPTLNEQIYSASRAVDGAR